MLTQIFGLNAGTKLTVRNIPAALVDIVGSYASWHEANWLTRSLTLHSQKPQQSTRQRTPFTNKTRANDHIFQWGKHRDHLFTIQILDRLRLTWKVLIEGSLTSSLLWLQQLTFWLRWKSIGIKKYISFQWFIFVGILPRYQFCTKLSTLITETLEW